MLKLARGEPTAIPGRLADHLIAVLYRLSLDEVRAMPADDYLDAQSFLAATMGLGRG